MHYLGLMERFQQKQMMKYAPKHMYIMKIANLKLVVPSSIAVGCPPDNTLCTTNANCRERSASTLFCHLNSRIYYTPVFIVTVISSNSESCSVTVSTTTFLATAIEFDFIWWIVASCNDTNSDLANASDFSSLSDKFKCAVFHVLWQQNGNVGWFQPSPND